MAQTHEKMFYEVMWRSHSQGEMLPRPWWVQQYFNNWSDSFDEGLFSSKEAAFASNASYRYWNMVGVKDHHQESLVGQSGEIEPVYDNYALQFFLFDPVSRLLHLPQFPKAVTGVVPLSQELEEGYLPIVITTYNTPMKIAVKQKVLATTLGARQRSVVLARLEVRPLTNEQVSSWLCLAVTPTGPTGFERHDKAGRLSDKRLNYLSYRPSDRLLEVNSRWGPMFDAAPASFGVYGNDDNRLGPDHYLSSSAFKDLTTLGMLNNRTSSADRVAGLCHAVFAWPFILGPGQASFQLDVKLPVDDYRGTTDLIQLQQSDANALEISNRSFWTHKLDETGLQAQLPASVKHLFGLFRICRANLLILADDGQIHPGPTIYDSFWVRDSSVEGIACALCGDQDLAEQQFGRHYPNIFNFNVGNVGPASLRGFFGGEHEINDREWDSNGQALWAISRFDRILGSERGFGAGLFAPYLIEGARWLRDNRSSFGLLHSGWSAEHLGEKDKPHYWDDFWGIAGLSEVIRLAERINAMPELGELRDIYNDLRNATSASIRWVLEEQQKRGIWQTFIPTGPADVGRFDSTMVGTLAYFHPCRLYMGQQLGEVVDWAARQTLETIWVHFVEGGFRHDSAWHAYGPYLTMQLAHCFLLIGDLQRMDHCLAWAVGNAAFASISRNQGDKDVWQVVQGAWNEQHCYPIATDFRWRPERPWYMGDIPHGWACAEFLLLVRDILFFEADEDRRPHIYVAPGVMPHWLGEGETIRVSGAETVFGCRFGYELIHRRASRMLQLTVMEAPKGVELVLPCRYGHVVAAEADGIAITVSNNDVWLPAGTNRAAVYYQ